MRNIDTVVFHHSVTDSSNKDIWSVSLSDHDYHEGYYIDGKEYMGNYHYMIWPDGEVKNPINHDHYTFHCGDYALNLSSLAVCFIGDYSYTTPTQEALRAANSILNEIKSKYNITRIAGHREIVSTMCPGEWWDVNKILEMVMLDQEKIRKAYLAVLRREPDEGGMNSYLASNLSEAELYYNLAESEEHTDYVTDALKWRNKEEKTGNYEKITEELYRKK